MHIYGLDLGTTNSCLSVLEDGRPRIIPVDGGLAPSVVSFDGSEMLVGRRALNRAAAFPEQSVKSVKRLMGTDEIIRLGPAEYRPEDISALILKHLVDGARLLEGREVRRAVITVPAYFSDAQRRATVEAGEKAGLTVERIVNEPTAAALFYDQVRARSEDGDEESGRDWKHALVYDLGGGTFDVSILRLGEIIEVLASTGDTRLGGDDFDARLAGFMLERLREEGGPDLSGHRPALARLTAVAEGVKITLSERARARVEEANLPTPDGRPASLRMEIGREELEFLTADLLDRTVEFVERALGESGLAASDIDRVLLVGGMTRLPAVAERLTGFFGRAPGAIVDPDLSVSLGAAVQGGIISGENLEQILVDVTAHTLSLETMDEFSGLMECVPIIPRNTPIPAARSRMFKTASHHQTAAELRVFQGESENPQENALLGETRFELAKAEAGCRIEVEYSYDLNGLVHVKAEQKGFSRQTEVRFDSRRPRAAGSQALNFYAGDESDDEEILAEEPAPAGLNFVLQRARTLLARAAGEKRAELAAALAEYEKALAEDREDLDDLEDELLALLDEV